MVFFQNVPRIGDYACYRAVNLVVVDIPGGVERNGQRAFGYCSSLTTVYFPMTLTSIGRFAFDLCSSLENVDLPHKNLQELGLQAFDSCSELKSMMIPDSLQTLGPNVFHRYSKLVPSNIIVGDYRNNTTSEVVAFLRSLQSPAT